MQGEHSQGDKRKRELYLHLVLSVWMTSVDHVVTIFESGDWYFPII